MGSQNLRRHAVLPVVVCAVVAMTACAPGWSRDRVFLSDMLTNPDLVVVSGELEQTEQLCQALQGCIEGWSSDQAFFYRFESNAAAAAFLGTVRDGFQSDRIVVDFGPTNPTDEEKTGIRELVEGSHSWT